MGVLFTLSTMLRIKCYSRLCGYCTLLKATEDCELLYASSTCRIKLAMLTLIFDIYKFCLIDRSYCFLTHFIIILTNFLSTYSNNYFCVCFGGTQTPLLPSLPSRAQGQGLGVWSAPQSLAPRSLGLLSLVPMSLVGLIPEPQV